MAFQKITDPELQCSRCEGCGEVEETTKLAFGTNTKIGPCEDCNGTGQNPATRAVPVSLTRQQIEYTARALAQVKNSLGEDNPDKEIYQRLHERFSQLL